MPPPDAATIDAAILARLSGDATLMGLMPGGVFFDRAPQGVQKFVLVSLVEEADAAVFGRRAIEDAVYLVKAVQLGTSGADVKAAAARIDALLEDYALAAAGYTPMAVHRVARFRVTEVDDVDQTINWQHRGGRYRVLMATA